MRWALLTVITVCLCGAVFGCGGATSSGTGVLAVTPAITAISGGAAPSGTITITGTNLSGAYTNVIFSGPVDASTTANSGGTTSITAIVPSQLTPGTYNVSVVDSDANGDVSSASNSIQLSVL